MRANRFSVLGGSSSEDEEEEKSHQENDQVGDRTWLGQMDKCGDGLTHAQHTCMHAQQPHPDCPDPPIGHMTAEEEGDFRRQWPAYILDYLATRNPRYMARDIAEASDIYVSKHTQQGGRRTVCRIFEGCYDCLFSNK